MKKNPLSLFPWASAVALMVMVPAAAHGQAVVPPLPKTDNVSDADRSRAERAYEEAYGAYGESNMPKALRASEVAFKALPNASTALIRATILAAMGRSAASFEAFLQAADLSPTGDERGLIEAGLAEHSVSLVPPLGWVTIKTTPIGATVTVGDASFPAPRTIGLPEGSYRIILSSKGYEGQTDTISVSAGRGSRERFALTPKAAEATGSGDAKAKAKKKKPKKRKPKKKATKKGRTKPKTDNTLAWAFAGGGGVSLISGIGFHAWAFSALDEVNRFRAPPESGETESQKKEREKRYGDAESALGFRQTMAYSLYLIGVGAAGYGAYLLFNPAEASGASASAIAVPLQDGAALLITGRF